MFPVIYNGELSPANLGSKTD